jgi:hypothetical protein
MNALGAVSERGEISKAPERAAWVAPWTSESPLLRERWRLAAAQKFFAKSFKKE